MNHTRSTSLSSMTRFLEGWDSEMLEIPVLVVQGFTASPMLVMSTWRDISSDRFQGSFPKHFNIFYHCPKYSPRRFLLNLQVTWSDRQQTIWIQINFESWDNGPNSSAIIFKRYKYMQKTNYKYRVEERWFSSNTCRDLGVLLNNRVNMNQQCNVTTKQVIPH